MSVRQVTSSIGIDTSASVWFSRCILILLAVLASGFSVADENKADPLSDFMNFPDREVYLKGDYFKALQTAYRDFEKKLARHKTDASSARSGNPELSLRLSRIENYDIHIEGTPESYIVNIGPSTRDQTHVVFGGGAKYVISRATFAIVDKIYYK
jgi:hypothetical protein